MQMRSQRVEAALIRLIREETRNESRRLLAEQEKRIALLESLVQQQGQTISNLDEKLSAALQIQRAANKRLVHSQR